MVGQRRIEWAILFGSLLALGCGDSSLPEIGGTRVGPHGGPGVALPADRGYGEVVLRRDRAAKKIGPPRLVVYFLGPDLNAPLSPAPADVRLRVIPPEGSPSTISLAAEPDPKDRLGSARFVSPPGDYEFDELRGELTATLGGRGFTEPFVFR